LSQQTTEMVLSMLAQIWPWLVAVVGVLLAVWVTVHAVLYKRDSRAVISWVGLAWLAPMLGAFAYFCFGINRIQRKAVSLKVRQALQFKPDRQITAEDVERRDRIIGSHPSLLGFAQLGRHLTGRPVIPGNRVDALVNGDEAYPAMIEAIDNARSSIALASYIFDSDRAGDAFFEALSHARDRGVAVRILIDDVGSRYSRPNMLKRLRGAGLNARSFLPTRVPRLPRYANLRNHRKILVVDGNIGFTGGTNIREGHWLSLTPRFPVQCLHFRLEGPVVEQLQEAFAIDWAFVSGESLTGDLWFPPIKRAGEVTARSIPHGPDEDFENMADIILGALSCARERVRIVTPYFLPDASLIRSLNVTAMRGVDVKIYLPSKGNISLVDWAVTAQLWQLLEKGCRIFHTEPPFDHTKVMTVDSIWSLIGSANWDPRSLRLNFEFNVECYDAGLARSLEEIVDQKAAGAREITLTDLSNRQFTTRLRDGLARLLIPYL